MRLLLRRDQKKGMMGGGLKFTLDAKAELSEDESQNVEKYKMGKTMLYTNLQDRGSGVMGFISRQASGSIELTVDDLVRGKHIECKDIVSMMSTEEQVKQACQQFKSMLDTAAHFGGDEIVEIA